MTLITADEWMGLARVVSHHVDRNEVDTFIEESEDIFIIPSIGVTLYEALVSYTSGNIVVDDILLSGEDVNILLNGGSYDADGERKRTKGLKVTLAYYTYAKVARNDGAILSRSGYMQHTDEYSQRLDDKQKANRYNDLMSIAETYLSGCLDFIKSKNENAGKVRGKRTTIKAIGD